MVRRVKIGSDGLLSPKRQAVVRAAAEVVERLVSQTTGPNNFQSKWEAFWNGMGKKMTPQPSLAAYRAAVKGRIVQDMDTTKDAQIQQFLASEKQMPLERQTAAVTKLGSPHTYIRQFAIDQGIDSVVTLLLHESFHGAGIGMGPLEMYEPALHALEADVGFPIVMGGADILDIEQGRISDLGVKVTFHYKLRQIDSEPLQSRIEIQIVSQDSGEIIHQENAKGAQEPVRASIPAKPGLNHWVWHARNPGPMRYAVRIVDMDANGTVMASKDFQADPRCIVGVSTIHCEGE